MTSWIRMSMRTLALAMVRNGSLTPSQDSGDEQ